jgi:hypothetical protein
VERLCDRAVYMEGGEVQFIGSVKEASAIYWETISDQILSQIRERFGTTPFPIKGTGDIRIVDVRLLNSGGEETTTFKHKSDLRVILEFEVKKTLKEPHFTVNILNPNMIPVAHSTTLGKVEKRRDLKPGRAQVECRLRNLQLLKGAYVIDVEVTDSKGVLKIGGMRNAAQFTVIEPPSDYHMVDTGHFALPAEWQFNVD